MDEQAVVLRGMRFCLCGWGTGTGPVVVLLHGWLDQAASWGRTAAALSAALGRRVVALDQRGHGRSDPAPAGTTYHFSEYLADLDALLRTLPGGPVDLVGHSMGGTVASQYAGARPGQVRRLVLVEGLGPPAVSDADAVAQLRQHLEQLGEAPARSRLADVAEGAARIQRLNPSLPPEEAERLAARILCPHPDGQGLTWRWDPWHRTRAAVAFDVRRYRLLLARIQAPATLLFGDQSGYAAMLPDLAERIACIPQVVGQHSLPTGHSPHLDDPDLLATHLAHAFAD